MNQNGSGTDAPPSYNSLFPEEPPPSYDKARSHTVPVVPLLPSAPSLPPESHGNWGASYQPNQQRVRFSEREETIESNQQRVQFTEPEETRESNFPRRTGKRSTVMLVAIGICALIGIIILIVIFTRSKNKCEGDMIYKEMVCECQLDCTNLFPGLSSICEEKCFDGCVCPDDRPVLYEGECIKRNECGDYAHPVTCSGDRKFDTCVSNCVLMSTCQTPYPNFCDGQCYTGCVCPAHVPTWNGHECVHPRDCDKDEPGGCPSSLQILNTHTGCRHHCTPTCRERNPKNCPYLCEPTCSCPAHIPYFHEGSCYSQYNCPVPENKPDGSPGECTGDRRPVFCASACPKTCFDMNPKCTDNTCVKCECPFEKPYYQSGSCYSYTACRYFNPDLPYLEEETDSSGSLCPIKKDDACSQGWMLGVNRGSLKSVYSCHESKTLEREVHVISVEKPLGNTKTNNEIKVEIGFDGSRETTDLVQIVLVLSNLDHVFWNLTYAREDVKIDQVFVVSPDTFTDVQHHVGFSVLPNTSRIHELHEWHGFGNNATILEPLLKYTRLRGGSISSFTGTKSTNQIYLKVGEPRCALQCSVRRESYPTALYSCPTAENLAKYSAFTSHTFTTLGATGPKGPRERDHPELLGTLVSLMDGMQCFTIPVSGRYNITASGASGGRLRNSGRGSTSPSYPRTYGATLSAVFSFEKGDTLRILVGQTGGDLPYKQYYATAGGGGSFVVNSNNQPILVAGGGGGIYTFNRVPPPACHGNLGPSGGVGYRPGIPGCAGYGATAAMPSRSGGGGAGYYGNGGYGIRYSTQPGRVKGGSAFIYGGYGADDTSGESDASDGGFGGGGAADSGAGGGGGYGGGPAGLDSNGNCGGGGGSYIDYNYALAVSKTQAYNKGHGKVIITRIVDQE